MNAFKNYEARARELMLSEDVRAFVLLNEHADLHGICPGCSLAIDGYESTRCGHARTCQPLQLLASGKPRMTWADKEAAVDKAAASFPAVFGLRAYPGDRFRIERRSSFYSDDSGVQLVVQRFCRDEAERIKYSLPSMVNDFTRDSPAIIRLEMVVELPELAKGGAK